MAEIGIEETADRMLEGAVWCSGVTIRFTPGRAVPTATKLRATIDASVASSGQLPLGRAFSWTFGIDPWTRSIATSADDVARGVAIDRDDNVYVTGHTDGELDGNANAGGSDAFLVKHDRNGSRLWTRQFGTVTADFATDVAIDGFGNVYVTGYTLRAIEEAASAGCCEFFVVKFNPEGATLWARRYGTPAGERAHGVATGSAGDVYVTGVVSGGPLGGNDAFLARYAGDGDLQWVRYFGTAALDAATSAVVDSAGNVYVAGYTWESLDGSARFGGSDAFIAKFDSGGSPLWARQFGSASDDVANAIALDAAGNLYVTGYTNGAFDGNTSAGNSDLFVVKFDGNGTRQWTRQFGSAAKDAAMGVAADRAGGIYVVGSGDPARSSPCGDVSGFKPPSEWAVCYYWKAHVLRYDSAGNLIWIRVLPMESVADPDGAYRVAVDSAGDAFVTSHTSSLIEFRDLFLIIPGPGDAFALKFQADGTAR